MAWTQTSPCKRSWGNRFWSKLELCLWKNTCAFPLSNGLAGTHLKDLASCQQLDTCAAVHRHAKDVHNLQTYNLARSRGILCTERSVASEQEVAYASPLGDR